MRALESEAEPVHALE